MNINDAAGVSALLDQLKSSVEWQELTTRAEPSSSQLLSRPTESSVADNDPIVSLGNESVASLLSQLKPLSVNAGATTSAAPLAPVNQKCLVEEEENLRNISFRAALPILSDLAEHESFVAAVKKVKGEQDALERDLWAQREAIYSKYHEKFKAAQTKAQMIGTSVSQYEIDMMTDAFKKEIYRFDRERVIVAWDGLIIRQQQELERLKVPAMFPTCVTKDRERQQQVVQVLETIFSSKSA